ncbi:MAG: hypothetical protein EXR67_01510 [Dehalococcoidia bacterium]|nr:hypothetical protein [Dehalococcoidia bacterium]
MEQVLFVCTGNTCRSPMAAAFFKHLAELRKVFPRKQAPQG